MFIAHSLKDETFGKAQNLHGATFIVDAEFGRPELDASNRVIDIGIASQVLKEVLSDMDYQNLDEREEFASEITTAEFLAKHIHEQISKRVAPIFSGKLAVTLHESHVAWASYEGDVG